MKNYTSLQRHSESLCRHLFLVALLVFFSQASPMAFADNVSENEKMRLGLRNFYGLDKSEAKTAPTNQPSPQSAQEILDAAKGGDVEAQFQLSNLYATGKGVLLDPQAALAWLKLAAKNNYPPALIMFGGVVEDGGGKNARASAYLLYEKAQAADEMARVYKAMSKDEKIVLRAFKQRQQKDAE